MGVQLDEDSSVMAPPEVSDEHAAYWAAFLDLIDDRPSGGDRIRRISWRAIDRYARSSGMRVDELKRVVWSLDEVLREHWNRNAPTG